jgi:capsular exopolysaccharide synthesis family protein
MSRLFDGLNRAAMRESQLEAVPPNLVPADVDLSEPEETSRVYRDVLPDAIGSRGGGDLKKALDIEKARCVMVQATPESRLVSWTAPNSLGAEKFRALTIRLDAMRRQNGLHSLQVTSSVINEGKTFVSANLAVTLAKYSGARTLVIEGDLHRPTLASTFGLNNLPGLSEWWSGRDQDIAHFLVRIKDTGLWLLPAGNGCQRPSDVLHSARLQDAFSQLASRFEWIVVDSTPMLPVIDVNLWSRLVDGMLLVVREGIAPLKAVKNGLQSLDHPKLIGVVLNEATEFNQIDYDGQYYGARNDGYRR